MRSPSNTSNPDVNSPNVVNDSDANVERENQETPTPPDRAPNVPVEEPPETDKPVIGEDGEIEPQRIV